jgi:uncharacterized membrane protein (UPF0136 family)
MKLEKINSLVRSSLQWLKSRIDIFAYALIFVAILLPSITPLLSDGKLNFNDDFFQYAGRHEAVRKAIFEYHTLPLRSFWFGGGYPTIGDPEDPTLNPLMIFTIIFGSVMSLKVIPFIAILIGGLSTYALARHILGYTKWGSLFSGLIFGLSLFVPLRIQDGNPNEVYAAFLPLCLLLVGLAIRGRKVALLILPFVLYTMISDGKLAALMAFVYLIILCIFDVIPIFNTFGLSERNRIQPLKIIILALIMTFFIGMVRILPAFDLINSKGGIGHIDLYFQPKTYTPEGVFAYTYQQLWQELIGWKKVQGLVTVGWLPVLLSLCVFYLFRRKSFPWGINLFFFGWLILAHNAPVDLLKLLWNVPIFSALYRPYKYFSFQIAFTFAIVSGQFFWLLVKMRPRWLEHIVAIILIVAGVWFLYPKMAKIQKETYTFDLPAEYQVKSDEFFNIQGKDIVRNRKEPLNSLTYTNLIRNIGTIDWHTGIPIAENAVPRYFVDAKGERIPNPNYHGEAYFLDSGNMAQAYFQPNSIIVQVSLQKPDTLIINQNYHRDWRTDHGRLFDRNGLIALQLDEIGTYNITLHYISRSFYIGLAVSALSLSVIIFICWSYKTRRLQKWSQNAPIPAKKLSQAVLWVIK